MLHLLFICSRNKWRSPTAEKIFSNQFYKTSSAGTEESARIKVSEKIINWADLIFVMEKKYKERLVQKFSHLMVNKTVVILDIPDDYKFMDEELIEMLKATVQPYLEQLKK